MDATDKIVLVTGASSGLGRAIARRFAAGNHTVIGVSRHRPDAALALWIPADLTCAGDGEKIARIVAEKYGRLDVLVNNAGMGSYATWEELPEAELRALFELDFFAAVALTKSLLTQLEKSGGSVINISSAAARLWVPCMGSYCAAKAALAMFSNTLGIELAGRGVRVLDVAPGQINTGFSRRAFGHRPVPDSPGSGMTSPEKLADFVYRACLKALLGKKR
ncbi:MAG: SDR family NAD(P)-dependent oxidoreductase, partial [Victivallaceae bacterium]|nr:SDR family NAD(P)-dependent oxidoreductase [Victivallaceae bacterium]